MWSVSFNICVQYWSCLWWQKEILEITSVIWFQFAIRNVIFTVVKPLFPPWKIFNLDLSLCEIENGKTCYSENCIQENYFRFESEVTIVMDFFKSSVWKLSTRLKMIFLSQIKVSDFSVSSTLSNFVLFRFLCLRMAPLIGKKSELENWRWSMIEICHSLSWIRQRLLDCRVGEI